MDLVSKWMNLALKEGEKCESIQSAFNVGAVLVKDNVLLSTGYSRELKGNTHAEECCLLKLQNKSLANGATIYSTMEPCGKRLSGKKCCAQLITENEIVKVIMGMKEPSTFVGESVGNEMLLKNGVKVEYLKGYESECLALNKHLI